MATRDALAWQSTPLSALHVNPRNPRSISKARFDALCYSMREDPQMLEVRPLIALPDGTVIAGNMRLRAAEALGWDTIPCSFVELDEDRAAQWLLRDNQNYGDWDDQMVAELMYELTERNADLALTGFDAESIRALIESVAPGGEDPHGAALSEVDLGVGDPEHQPVTGERWRVGRHTLVVAGVFDGWREWAHLLDEADVLFVPYPGPHVPLSKRAQRHRLVMVQPDAWLAGHLLDKCASVLGDDEVVRVAT